MVEKTAMDEVMQDGKWNIVVHQPPEAMVRPQADTIHGVHEPLLMAVLLKLQEAKLKVVVRQEQKSSREVFVPCF